METHLHQPNNGRTILDYLNEDCWRAVLEYVPVKDIVHTEPTSKRWQRIVLEYLSHVRISVVRSGDNNKNHQLLLRDEDYSSFKCWTYKLGSSVVSFEKHGDTDDGLETLRKNCPNLEVIKLMSIKKLLPENRTGECFHHLQELCIENCLEVTDDCVSKFLENHALEELKILSNEQVTGKCLMHLNLSNLKSLVFRSCRRLKFAPLLSVADRLGGLTKLVLARSRYAISDKVHLLIDKLPKLEYLTILCLGYLQRCNDFFKSVCRLKNLKRLSSTFCMFDNHLEAVAQCCKQLEVLKSHCRFVTGRGVGAVCRGAGARLTALDLGCSEVTENDIVALVYACPNLTWLRLSFRDMNDVELGTRVAAARREMRAETRLHLVLEDGLDPRNQDAIEGYKDELADVLEIHLRDDEFDSDGVEDYYADEIDPSDSD